MIEEAGLLDSVLKALDEDPNVTSVFALNWEGLDTFVVGVRKSEEAVWGMMSFVIALEERQGDMRQLGHERLQQLKEGFSSASSNKGTAWFGVASTVQTAIRISKGEIQLEPPNSS